MKRLSFGKPFFDKFYDIIQIIYKFRFSTVEVTSYTLEEISTPVEVARYTGFFRFTTFRRNGKAITHFAGFLHFAML